jgi:hypothetical protein
MTKSEFLKNVDNWCNHRFFLWKALETTKHLKLPVLELGCGHGSTPYLQQYCKDNDLYLVSYDYNKFWANKFGAETVNEWSDLPESFWTREYAVALVDESPGEHRKVSIQLLINTKIIVVHDTEPIGWNASDYQVRPLFKNFKYHVDYQMTKPDAWASALSNEIDVTEWK